jgi:hypothetical protein
MQAFATETSVEIPSQVTNLGVADATSFSSASSYSNYLNSDPGPSQLTATAITYSSMSSSDNFTFNAPRDANRPAGPIQQFVSTTNYNAVANGLVTNNTLYGASQGTPAASFLFPHTGPTLNLQTAPEPATWMMALTALAGAALVRYRARPQ